MLRRSVVVAMVAGICVPIGARADRFSPPAGQSPTLASGPPLELALGAQLLELPDVAMYPDEQDVPLAVAAAFASASAGTRGLDLGVGAAARVAGLGCPIVDAEVQAHVRTERDEHAIGTARVDTCLINAFLHVRAAELVTANVPSFATRASLWRRPYRGTFTSFEVGAGGTDLDAVHVTWSVEVMVAHAGYGLTEQSDGAEMHEVVELVGGGELFRFRRLVPRQLVDAQLLAVEDDALRSDGITLGGRALRIYPLRGEVDFGDWYAGGAIGVLESGREYTEDGAGRSASKWDFTVDEHGLPVFHKVGGYLRFGRRGDGYDASAKVERTLYPTFDGGVALDARASADVQLAVGAHRGLGIDVAPFLARTTMWARDTPAQTEVTAGARVQVGHALWRGLHVDAIGEAGRSPYARLDGGRAPTPALGAQAIVAVTAKRSGMKLASPVSVWRH